MRPIHSFHVSRIFSACIVNSRGFFFPRTKVPLSLRSSAFENISSINHRCLVINVRSVNIFWITAVKSVAFCKCCLRFLVLPINPNICFSIQSCMQMSSLKYATRTKETDIQLSISSYVLLKTAIKGASLKGRTLGSVANEKNSLCSSNCAPNVKIEIISKCKSQAAIH